jgi:hemerythrin
MFRWTMSLETGIAPIDREHRILIDSMAEFFRIIDDPLLNKTMVAERTGAVYAAMKAAFAVEDAILAERTPDSTQHQEQHAALVKSYVDLCRKVVPKIRGLKQAQQTCLEIFRVVDDGLYKHLKDEVLSYRTLARTGGEAKSA